MFSLVGHRAHTVQTVMLASDRAGHLMALRHDADLRDVALRRVRRVVGARDADALYACPNAATSHRLVRIDAPTPTFMRAPGESSGTFALESAMDELAYAIDLDPLVLRLRNYANIDPDEDKPWSSKSLRECYRVAAEKFGWNRRPMQPRSMRDGHELVGWGMATATYPARVRAASARAHMRADGTVLVQAGTQDLGTGTYTVMTQIAADALGIPIERITFELGDTTFPETPGSGGSTTASTVGPAVRAACLELKQKLAAMSPEQRAQMGEVVAEAKTGELPERQQGVSSTHAFGADFVEVRADEDLGRVRVSACRRRVRRRYDPSIRSTARSQFMGGLVWAIGMALQEHTVRDARTARVVTRDLADYHVPVNADIPPIDVIQIDEIDPHVNALGTKGIGEIGITGATAAIANAIFHATGKRIRDLPITLDKLVVRT